MEARRRILAIDPGEKRFGFAVSDPLGITAQGLETLAADGVDAVIVHVQRLVSVYNVERIVLGLPLSMGGAEIEGSARARELAGRLEKACGVPVVLRDERMTSREAERVLGDGDGRERRPERGCGSAGGGRRTKGTVDRLAAVLLLQSYLDEREGSC